MQCKSFLDKFIKITTLAISPFVILIMLTPITNIPAYINLGGIGIGTLVSLALANRLQNNLMVIQFKNKAVFYSELNTHLREIGYEQFGTNGTKITYRGTPKTCFLADDIYVTISTGKTLITAPKIYLKKLSKLLPLTNIYLVDQAWTREKLNFGPYLLFHHCPFGNRIKKGADCSKTTRHPA